MYLYKHKNGFYYVYHKDENGKRRNITTKTKLKSEATKFMIRFGSRLKEQIERDTIPIQLKKMMFNFLIYSESVHSFNHTITLKSTFKEMLKFFGDCTAADITKEKILDYIQFRSRLVSPHTVKRDIESISSMLNWAMDHKYVLKNYCRGIKRPKLPEKLPVFFTRYDFDQFIGATTDEDLKDIFIFAVNTGLRQMELLKLEWSQTNIESKLLILDNRNHLTKSKRIRTLPLNPIAIKILEKRSGLKSRSNYIFTYQGKELNQQFISHKTKKIVKRASINPKLNFHSLRHTFASWLVQAGVSIYEVSKLLGHSDIKTTQIYAHLGINNLSDAVNKLNAD